MFIVVWAMSGLLASSLAYTLYPKEISGSPAAVVLIAVFLLLGGLDYLTTVLEKRRRHGIKFR